MAAILVVDPDDSSSLALRVQLRSRGHHVEARADTSGALTALAAEEFEIVLVDAAIIGQLSALREMREQHPTVSLVCMTLDPTVTGAVEVMRAGASDYLRKPLDANDVELLLARLLSERPHGRASGCQLAPLLTSHDPAMSAAIALARQAADADVPILLIGEGGTGKRTIAQAIHRWSGRRARPFVSVWCSALTEQRVERRLIGHLRGAFTTAPAMPRPTEAAIDGGTMCFDDVGQLPQSLQVKVLRLLEEQSVRSAGGEADLDMRIIAASQHDLATDVHTGRLREDLFFRLNVVTIHLPALRARPADLIALRDHVLATLSARHHRPPIRFTDKAEDLMARHQWPGNVRELISVLESAVVLAPGELIDHDHLATSLRMASSNGSPAATPIASLEEMEQQHIRLVLQQCATFEEAAARLQINPATLWRKRKRYHLDG